MADVITCLENHGCQNISSHLDLASCSTDPVTSYGLADVYQGKLADGSQVAIKTRRVSNHDNKTPKLLKVPLLLALHISGL